MLRRGLSIIFVFILATCPAIAAEPDFSDFMRLHVVAYDNSTLALDIKYAVRDACLDLARSIGSDCSSGKEMMALVSSHIDEFAECANQAARDAGYDGLVTAQTGVFPFPDRLYGELLVPAGDYMALKITLGNGEGHNWWCVLYPSLCALDEAEYASSDCKDDGSDCDPVFYSSVGRWLSNLISGGN